jgi:hypothetical protein
MEPVSAKELAYQIWKYHPTVYAELFDHLTMSDAGVELDSLPTERLLTEILGIRPRSERTYYEMLGWVTYENEQREEYLEFQRKLREPCD